LTARHIWAKNFDVISAFYFRLSSPLIRSQKNATWLTFFAFSINHMPLEKVAHGTTVDVP